MKNIIFYLHGVLDKFNVTNWLGILLFLIVIFRIPSFFEPYYYGDEMIYLSLGQGVRQGETLYRDLHDNKPPLLYLTAAVSGNLFWFRAILCFWMLGTTVIFWNLAKKLLPKKYKLATIIFAVLTTIPLLEGNIANAELFMVGPSLLAFLILIFGKNTTKWLIFSGFLFGISVLFKFPAIFDVPVIIFYWLITQGLNKWKDILRKTLLVSVGLLLPIILTAIWYAVKGVLPEYLIAAFLQNLGYVSSFRPDDTQKPFFIRNAPLIARAGVVLLGSFAVYFARKKLSKKFILFSLWTLFSLFAVTLSERPYPHYLIQSAGVISMLTTILLSDKTFEQVLSLIPLSFIAFVPFYYHFYHYPTFSYYQKFINFSLGKINREAYLNSFSPYVTRNYEIADFLNKSIGPKQKVLVLSPDSPAIYALSRRLPPVKYVADYHIKDFSSTRELVNSLKNRLPEAIVITPEYSLPEISEVLDQGYILVTQIGNADIWTRYAN